MKRKMNLKLGLLPVIERTSRVLILGTMPGDESIRLGQYYAHRDNQFWKILTEIYREHIETDYEQRIEFLHRKGLALWDVLHNAERMGSLDTNIKNGVPNDFACLLNTYTNLEAIVFNGGKAQKLFSRYIERSQTNIALTALHRMILPSTSSTPGKYVLSLEEKTIRWNALTTL